MPAIIEWDMDNGEIVTRLPYDSMEEAERALERIIKEAEEEGWICEPAPCSLGGYICIKDSIQRHVYIED